MDLENRNKGTDAESLRQKVSSILGKYSMFKLKKILSSPLRKINKNNRHKNKNKIKNSLIFITRSKERTIDPQEMQMY